MRTILERYAPVHAAAKDGSGSAGAQSSSKAARASSAKAAREPVDLPTSDQEFTFKSMADAPAWVDPNWASFDRGPALALPANPVYDGVGPYTTITARVGDKVVFTAAKGAQPAKFTVVQADSSTEEGVGTRRMPAMTNASLEDQLKTGWMTPDELGSDAAAQVIARSPGMRKLIEEGKNAPKEQNVSDVIKT
jgi:hypothetical protein